MSAPKAQGAVAHDPQPVFDAGVVILTDLSGAEPKILFGRRRADNVFLPNKWVFPGGRFDPADLDIAPADALESGDLSALMWGMPDTFGLRGACALALTAVRETFEETGLILGKPGSVADPVPQAWAGFAALGFRPSLAALTLIARAITPPGRPRRYDTRFFLADVSAIAADTGSDDGEFTEKAWFSLTDCKALDLPNITRHVLKDTVDRLVSRQEGRPVPHIPFYYQDRGTYRRDLIAHTASR